VGEKTVIANYQNRGIHRFLQPCGTAPSKRGHGKALSQFEGGMRKTLWIRRNQAGPPQSKEKQQTVTKKREGGFFCVENRQGPEGEDNHQKQKYSSRKTQWKKGG